MRKTSAIWKRIGANDEHTSEYKLTVNGIDVTQEDIEAIAVRRALFDKLSVGNAYEAELSTSFYPALPVPRMAQITVSVRLCLKSEVTEWLPKGTFYIDTRREELDGMLTITAYDAMLRAERVWLDPSSDTGEWPMSMPGAVQNICAKMGIQPDPRNVIYPYSVEYPNDLTMREVLAYIAAAHGGNFIITDEGKLRLITLAELPDETNLLIDDSDGGAILFGEVRLIVG